MILQRLISLKVDVFLDKDATEMKKIVKRQQVKTSMRAKMLTKI